VKFEHTSDAGRAFKGLNAKLFDKRLIACAFFEKDIMRKL
jgi:hypothetical protein